MVSRVLPPLLAFAIFLGAGGYTLRTLDAKSLSLAEIARDACLRRTGAMPEAANSRCTRPMRAYATGRIWRFVFAASVGATMALLVVGGLLILMRRQSGEAEVPPGRSGP
ncbi:MAG TPA: hypothetical protein VGW40_12495 [Allosphingosinicella sp.]|nr:hypothetical protein [Allosphingosinicella sp.]